MEQIEIDIVSLQALEAIINTADQVESGQANVVGCGKTRTENLSAKKDIGALSFERLADDLFG